MLQLAKKVYNEIVIKLPLTNCLPWTKMPTRPRTRARAREGIKLWLVCQIGYIPLKRLRIVSNGINPLLHKITLGDS